ncbi:hypothetical protein Q9314_24625 (plasmid) [Shinella sumterensis]|nr:hypothetical protein Q9314_24625 [Shinella sumterensis]
MREQEIPNDPRHPLMPPAAKAGGYATHVCARADHCLPIPAGLTLNEAAALPEGLFTIWHNLFDRGALRSGEILLIEGGASGIGTLALQLGNAVGAKVIATAGGPEKCARITAMGACAVDYRKPGQDETRRYSHSPKVAASTLSLIF